MGAIGNVIPELVNSFNVYLTGNKLVGVSGEVELPELEAMTETIELAGNSGNRALQFGKDKDSFCRPA